MFDVAIIGCGPVGALAANLLGKNGLKVLVLEKEANPYPLPRAVHLDHEMMRLFQSANVIDRVKDDMRDTEGHLHIGADHGVIRYMGTVGKPRPFGWSNDYFFYQPELEDHLRDGLSAYANVDLRLGTEFLSLTQADNQVTLTLSGPSGDYEETARWVIACDGASSKVRKSLGINLDDLQFEEPWLVVDVEVDGEVTFPALTGVPAEANLQQLSVMMCDPNRPATVVPGRGNHRRWELMLLPGEDDQEMMKPENVAKLIGPWLEGVTHDIVRAATYRFHGLIAEQWKDGNVFLAGDAAHQTPPFFGQGMCHGLRDVANLAWKMSSICQGAASEALLDTYQPERDPHVRAVISAAVDAGRYICVLDKDAAAARDTEIREKAKKQTMPQSAADLIPPVSCGIVAAGTAAAGERFIQPFVATSEGQSLLDDQVKGQWRLFVANHNMLVEAQQVINDTLPLLDVTVVDASTLEDKGEILSWLANKQAQAVFIRPDFYVYGTADTDVATLITTLALQLN
ncbi:bifunctional 3-(3-hydroxy-phenyl)propionate/3-hydroxycinnamic acid hydroxylase [Aestuariicella hydrocarbonica]|uniref:Bifunctional 3-(3-hydroxy-phenyl)propionate/3-hydroxycinnamic acid hydroxylase n=1 Tax=Pseudomaricurvus hydrocarbonicus TaxID=1470433 RepID=A0A9E5MLC4_9GAMM|nr:bifunctional 3-(3-hydroxy-phenyl)propionate/3-hydroxycinnamic acid hydroxylase [Aestuariicella hydrocarbonica]NHO66787.1 bifunctional 3-(3-hydroxy-phenyl)propionate/3-hydroxycinnamic acid hydroxylase [Aestuariicella hydrocarbonica]